VILIGGIGGLIFHGLIGLFVGAVVFSIGYRLIVLTRESSQEAVAVSGTAGFGDDGG
jgi:predicted PurR-regulated permease PerM